MMKPSFRIVVVNNRYFLSGGSERYLFNFTELFSSKNHSIVPFALRYLQNEPSPYSHYFVKPRSREDQVFFQDFSFNLQTILRIMSRSLYSFQVKRALTQLIQKEKVQITYLLQHYGSFSPSVIDASKALGVPVVLRPSDFFLLCLNNLFLKRGRVCEDCLQSSLWSGVKGTCVKNSFWLSLFRAFSLYLHRKIKIYEKVDAFVCPSQYLREKLLQGGFPGAKVYHVPTFLDANPIQPQYQSDPYILYFGPISQEKGVAPLVQAWQKLNLKNEKLFIAGRSPDGEESRLKKYIREKEIKNIEFKGFQNKEGLANLISRARFTIVPSICYENMPNTLLESFAYGKPVVASNLGSIPEVVRDQIDGLLFEPNNPDDLAEKINWMLANPQKIVEMGKNGRQHLEKDFTPDQHYQKLMGIFSSLLNFT